MASRHGKLVAEHGCWAHVLGRGGEGAVVGGIPSQSAADRDLFNAAGKHNGHEQVRRPHQRGVLAFRATRTGFRRPESAPGARMSNQRFRYENFFSLAYAPRTKETVV
jgi:hypothetical protein